MAEKVCGSEQGVFNFNGGNEFEFDAITAVHEDPMMIRRGSTITANGGGGGVDSWDNIPNGPGQRRVQMIMLHGEQSEMVRGQAGCPMGSLKLQLNDGNGEADGNMKTAFQLESRSGISARDGSPIEAFTLGDPQWESLARQLSPRLGGGATLIPFKLVSQDGRFEMTIQGDGNFVTYDLHATPPKAIWSSFTGLIR